MKKETKELVNSITYKLLGLIFVIFILFKYSSFTSAISFLIGLTIPFVIGGLLAIYANVLLNGIENLLDKIRTWKKLKVKRSISLLLTIFILIVSLVLILGTIVPTILSATIEAATSFPKIYRDIESSFDKLPYYSSLIPSTSEISSNIDTYSQELINFLDTNSQNLFTGGLSAIGGTLSKALNMFLGLVFSLYILIEKEKLSQQVKRFGYAFFDNEIMDIVVLSGQRFLDIFSKFLVGSAKEAVVFGLINYGMLFILGFPYKATISIIIAILMIIPYFGGIFAGVVGTLLVSSQSIESGLIFLLVYTILQQLESNMLYPYIVGDEVGLPGIWVMVSVTLGGALLGLIGMVMAVPIATLVYTLLGDILDYKNDINKNEKVKLSEYIRKTNEN